MPSQKIGKQIGERVKTLRKKCGETQEDVAAKMNCDKRTIQRIENGEDSINVKHLNDISKALGITIDKIITVSNGDHED